MGPGRKGKKERERGRKLCPFVGWAGETISIIYVTAPAELVFCCGEVWQRGAGGIFLGLFQAAKARAPNTILFQGAAHIWHPAMELFLMAAGAPPAPAPPGTVAGDHRLRYCDDEDVIADAESDDADLCKERHQYIQ